MSLCCFESVVLVPLHQHFSLSCYTAEHRSAGYFLIRVYKFYSGLIFFRDENFMVCCCLKENYKTSYSNYATKMAHHESLCELGSTYSTTWKESIWNDYWNRIQRRDAYVNICILLQEPRLLYILASSSSSSSIPVAPTWSIGHPWNASFHFSFLI
jgi:hypothetical protein